MKIKIEAKHLDNVVVMVSMAHFSFVDKALEVISITIVVVVKDTAWELR